MIELNRTFVTSDHHFRYWKHPFHLHCESTEEEEREHIALWNSIVGKDDLVFYVGDFCDGTDHDLQEIRSQLNGRLILIKGNHDKNSDEAYRQAFEDVLEEKRIDERIHDSGAKGHPDYARRYITRIARKRNEEPRQASGWRHI